MAISTAMRKERYYSASKTIGTENGLKSPAYLLLFAFIYK